MANQREGGGRRGGGAGTSSAREAASQKIAGTTGAGATVDPQDPLVYMGRGYHGNALFRDAVRQSTTRKRPTVKPMTEAIAQFYDWSDEQREQWGQYLVSVGRIKAEDAGSFELLRDEWERAVKESARFTARGKNVSPHDVARLMGVAEGATGKFTGAKTTRSSQVDLTNPEKARALVNNVLREQLGRDAKPEEIAEFVNVLNRAERENPSVTSTTTQFVDGEAVSASQTTSGGISDDEAIQMASDQAKQNPDYGAYQAATRLMNALFSDLISSPV